MTKISNLSRTGVEFRKIRTTCVA